MNMTNFNNILCWVSFTQMIEVNLTMFLQGPCLQMIEVNVNNVFARPLYTND